MPDSANYNSLIYRYRIAIFVIILIISLSLRLCKLSSKFVYVDEYKAVEFALTSPRELLYTLSTREPHPPLHYLLIHYWMKLVNPSLLEMKSSSEVLDCDTTSLLNNKFVLRLPGIFFSMLTLILLYGFASRIYDYKIALSSAFIFSLSRFETFWAQTIRYPTFIMLLGLISTYLFYLVLIKLKGNNFHKLTIVSIGYILSTVAGLYTHYYMFLVMLFQNIYFFVKYQARSRDLAFSSGAIYRTNRNISQYSPTKKIGVWLLIQSLVIIGFLFWLPILLKQLRITSTDFYGVAHATISSIPLLLYRFLFMYGLQTYTPVGGFQGLVCYAIFTIIFIFSIKGNKLIIYLNLFVPIIVIFLLTPIKQLFVEHYFMFCFPAYAIFMGVGLAKITKSIATVLIRQQIIPKRT